MSFPVACRWAHDATGEAASAWGAAVAHLRGWTLWNVHRARRMHIGEVDGACCHLAGLWAVIAAPGPAQVPDRLYDLGADAAVLDAAVWGSALAWGLAGLRALGYAAHGRASRRIARRVRICRLRGDLGMSP
jgi:hypothetical protein